MDGFRHFFRLNNRTSPELGSHQDADLGDRGQTKSPQDFRNPLEILENAGRKRGNNKKTDRSSPTQKAPSTGQSHLNDDPKAPSGNSKGKGLKVHIQGYQDQDSSSHDERNPISHGHAGSPKVASTYPHSLFTRPHTPINSPSSVHPNHTKEKLVSDDEKEIPKVPQVPEQHVRGGSDKAAGAIGSRGVDPKTAWPLQAKHLSEKKPLRLSPTSDRERRKPGRIVIASPDGSTRSENSNDESSRRGSHKGSDHSEKTQPRYSTMPNTQSSSRGVHARSVTPQHQDHLVRFRNNPRTRESVDAENAAAMTVQPGEEEDISLEEVPPDGSKGKGERPTQQKKLPIGTAVSTPTTPTFTIDASLREMKFPKPPKPPSIPTESRNQARTRTFDSQRSETPSVTAQTNRRNGAAKSGDSNADKSARRNGGNNKMASVAEEERLEGSQSDATITEGADAPPHQPPAEKKAPQQQRQTQDDKDDGVVRVNGAKSVPTPILPQRRRIEEVQDEDEKRHGSGRSTPKGARSAVATSAVSRSRDRNDQPQQQQQQQQQRHHGHHHQARNLSQSRSLSQTSVHSGAGGKRGRGANKFSSAAWYGFVGEVAMSGKSSLVEV
ncbi:MAG: hypothetical protein M1831_006582 [Alyxoria varia]|nr:MAG: hypothetical protein M1831_006582 [Alyxoria varia]